MPLGISSAPEIFQRRIHTLIEGLQGIEVVADDFVAVGFGETQDEAMRNHDQHLHAFLQRCMEKGIRLNPEKVQLRLTKVPCIGHIATDKGLCADPAMIRAITENASADRRSRHTTSARNGTIPL